MNELSLKPPRLLIQSVDQEPSYVLGFPVHIALEIDVDASGAEVRTTLLDFISTYGGLGAVLTDAAGSVVFEHRSRQGVDLDEAPPLWIRSGHPQRMLVDVSEILPATLVAGDYQAQLGILGSRPPVFSHLFPLSLRPPTEAECVMLNMTQRGAGQTWGEWACTPPPDDFVWTTPTDPRDPLRFSATLREMLMGQRSLSSWARQDFAALDGVYAPEREALWAEVLHAQGNAGALRAQCSAVLKNWPGLSDWMAEIQSGRGPIASLRAALTSILSGQP